MRRQQLASIHSVELIMDAKWELIRTRAQLPFESSNSLASFNLVVDVLFLGKFGKRSNRSDQPIERQFREANPPDIVLLPLAWLLLALSPWQLNPIESRPHEHNKG